MTTQAFTRPMTATDSVAPTGFAVAFDAASYQLGVDADAVGVDITGAELGAAYELTIESSGGGDDVVLTGNCPSAAFSLADIDCSGLTDGTLTATLVLTDAAGNDGTGVTDTATLAAA